MFSTGEILEIVRTAEVATATRTTKNASPKDLINLIDKEEEEEDEDEDEIFEN